MRRTLQHLRCCMTPYEIPKGLNRRIPHWTYHFIGSRRSTRWSQWEAVIRLGDIVVLIMKVALLPPVTQSHLSSSDEAQYEVELAAGVTQK